ncbi:DUF4232 domain-containing protein [Streptomyces sp. NPDC058382]|uniref:DUF4232 domain-containing protein n=1 Tax=unclassified Streptomyces TaxID=2593676 RepID=UPI00363009A9
MRARKLTFAALALAAGLSLTACQNDDEAVGQTDPAANSSAPAASSSDGGSNSSGSDQVGAKDSARSKTGGSSSVGSASGGSGPAAKTGKCTTDGLKITAKNTFIDGDPDGNIAVELTNTSGSDCVISGFAGVDLKTSAGTISATRKGKADAPYTLKNGKEIDFYVSYPLNKTGGSGVSITGLVVTPPNETKSVTLAWPGESSLPAGDSDNGGQVLVGPVGSAGQGG